MGNLEYKLTVDDLIVEYMMYKTKNGYEPSFSTSEFMEFLCFFESSMEVEDQLYEKEKLFQRFFERKAKSEWSRIKNWSTMEKHIEPHMEIRYNENEDDYIISANYKLSDFDKSTINTYFMDNGCSKFDDFKGTAAKIRNIIGEYLANQPKRKIDESIEISEKDLNVGKYYSAEIITQIWLSHISKQIEYKMWPEQCTDINKYLFDIDLAEIINVDSIKKELIQIYDVFSKRIARLYKQDKDLKIASCNGSYLARSNYELLIQGYEDIIGTTFGPYKKEFDINLSKLTFTESHKIDGVYYEDDDPEVKTTILTIGNGTSKKLVRNIEKNGFN